MVIHSVANLLCGGQVVLYERLSRLPGHLQLLLLRQPRELQLLLLLLLHLGPILLQDLSGQVVDLVVIVPLRLDSARPDHGCWLWLWLCWPSTS